MQRIVSAALLLAAAVSASVSDHQLECMACQDGIRIVDFALDSSFVKGNLEALLGGECAKLPTPYSSNCNATVHSGFNLIVSEIQGFLNVTCSRVLSCTATDMAQAAMNKIVAPTSEASFSPCSIFETLYKDMPTEITYFEKICTELPADRQQGCKDFFAQHPDWVVNMGRDLLQKLVGMIPFLNCQLGSASMAAAQPNALACMGCNDGVELLNFLLDTPFTAGSLEHLLGSECQKLPADYRESCNTTVYQGIALILKDIKDFDAVICQDTLGCPAKQQVVLNSLDEVTAEKTNGFCGVMKLMYDNIPNAIPGFRHICESLSTTTAQKNCNDMFAEDSADLITLAQNVLKEAMDIVPFEHCELA